MNEQEAIDTSVQEAFEQLKKAANRSANWRERLQAVEALGQQQFSNSQTIRLLMRLMENDRVRQVQEAAHQSLRKLGESVTLPPKTQEELIKGLTKTLVRIKKSLPEGHTYEQFKDKLKKMRIDIYDTYEGDKGADFDSWLEAKWAELRTR